MTSDTRPSYPQTVLEDDGQFRRMVREGLVEIDPADYRYYSDEVTPGGYLLGPQSDLPVDEWECADCGTYIGYYIDEESVAGGGWKYCWAAKDADAMDPATEKFCEDCLDYWEPL